MQEAAQHKKFHKLPADYFHKKAKEAKGSDKLLVALEMSKYLTEALQNNLSFEELEKSGFKFATLPDIKD
jgi:hypothetical protein